MARRTWREVRQQHLKEDSAHYLQEKERIDEMYAIAALLHGSLQELIQMELVRSDRSPVAIDRLEQGTDSEGNYYNHFTVVTQSGIRIRIEITPEEDQA